MIYKRNDGSIVEFITALENSDNFSVFKHFKDKEYKIITLAKDSETTNLMVVYQALYDDLDCYVRPAEMFFSRVDQVKYPMVNQEYRFQLLKR